LRRWLVPISCRGARPWSSLGFEIFVLSAPTIPSESAALKRAAGDVVERHFPDAPALYSRRGCRLPTSIRAVVRCQPYPAPAGFSMRDGLRLRAGSASHGRQAALRPPACLAIAEKASCAVGSELCGRRWCSHKGRLGVEAGFAASKLFEHRPAAVTGKTLGYENVFSKPARGISR